MQEVACFLVCLPFWSVAAKFWCFFLILMGECSSSRSGSKRNHVSPCQPPLYYCVFGLACSTWVALGVRVGCRWGERFGGLGVGGGRCQCCVSFVFIVLTVRGGGHNGTIVQPSETQYRYEELLGGWRWWWWGAEGVTGAGTASGGRDLATRTYDGLWNGQKTQQRSVREPSFPLGTPFVTRLVSFEG